MKTLDKQKPFGTVHGDEEGRVYVQDGVYFDGEGHEWQAKPEPEPKVAEAPKKK